MKSIDNRRGSPGNQDSGILSEDAFHHSGFGGSIGFADPRADLALGYVMNKQGQGTLFNPRGQSLVDAAYRSIGYTEVARQLRARLSREAVAGRDLSRPAPAASAYAVPPERTTRRHAPLSEIRSKAAPAREQRARRGSTRSHFEFALVLDRDAR